LEVGYENIVSRVEIAGIGSKSQLVSGDSERSLETSSVVTQVKNEKLGGVNGGGK